MNAKIAGVLLMVLLSLSVTAKAQGERQHVDDRLSKMTMELSLTSPQVDAVRPIIKAYMAKREEALQETEWAPIIDLAGLRRKMRLLKQDEYQQLRQVLSKDQMARWIQKENLRASLNQGEGESLVEDDATLTPNGANFKF